MVAQPHKDGWICMMLAKRTTALRRVLAILGHYYGHGEIIAHAPAADVEIYLGSSDEGSFKQTVLAGTVGAVLAAPFVSFVDHTVKSWLPSPDGDTKKIVALLEEQNRLL